MIQVKNIDRQDLINKSIKDQKENLRVPCIITYHPKLKQVSTILKDNFEKISNDPCKTLKTAFPDCPMVAFRKLPTIKNKLVRTDIHTKKLDNLQNTNTKCHRSRCKTCHIFKETNTITNVKNKRYLKIKNGGNCSTKNIVYAISCKVCNSMYIGQTGRSASERIAGHKSDILSNTKPIETTEHFNQRGHSINDMEFTIIEHNPNWNTEEREAAEDHYMCLLHTLSPSGMNRRCGDFAKYFYSSF